MSAGDPSFVNLAIIQAAGETNEKLKKYADKLQTFIGIKARYF